MNFGLVAILIGLTWAPGITGLGNLPALTVELEFFSGRECPTWTIAPNSVHYQKIFRLLQTLKTAHKVSKVEYMPAKLGFRGFVVNDGSKDILVLGKGTRRLQQLLLKSMPWNELQLSEKIVKMVTEALKLNVEPDTTAERRLFTPWPAGGHWETIRTRYCNNCYNYATDIINPTGRMFAQPGLGSGRIYRSLTADAVKNASINDNLKVLETPPAGENPTNPDPDTHHVVALVVAPDVDFHWYRLDQNNKWSHKPGSTSVRNVDGNGDLITDPRTAANSPYGPNYQFVAFMSVNKNTATIRGFSDRSGIC